MPSTEKSIRKIVCEFVFGLKEIVADIRILETSLNIGHHLELCISGCV